MRHLGADLCVGGRLGYQRFRGVQPTSERFRRISGSEHFDVLDLQVVVVDTRHQATMPSRRLTAITNRDAVSAVRRRRSRRARVDVAPRRNAGGLVGGRPELEQASTECDGAHREPCTAERQTRDHVAEPVHVEQHAAASHHDNEPGCDPPMAARTARPRPRVSSSAAAAKKAADHDEWPLGNDGPSVSAIGLSAGRTRSTSS